MAAASTSKMIEKTLSNIFQFKINLRGSKPNIWRRIQVPENYTFWDLHVAIQDAMGWDDCHLHKFEMVNPTTGEKDLIGIPNHDVFGDTLPETATKIDEYFLSPKNKAIYEYDFGDGWNHNVILEKILPAITGTEYPKCLAGRMACPPENCGGLGGYDELKEILANPTHEEYKERLEWLCGEFEPKSFNPKSVNFDNPKERFKTAHCYFD